MGTWKTADKGIRYREHASRKHGIRKDRYYALRYQKDGKRVEEGLGWTSEGWTLEKARIELATLKNGAQTGEGPERLKEKRSLAKKQKQAAIKKEQEVQRSQTTFKDFWKYYWPLQKIKPKVRWTLKYHFGIIGLVL